MWTPHLPGSPLAADKLIPLTEPAADFRQLQAAFLSAGVEAMLFSDLIPLQQAGDGLPPPVSAGMQGARLLVTWPHVTLASVSGAATSMHNNIIPANLKTTELAIFSKF